MKVFLVRTVVNPVVAVGVGTAVAIGLGASFGAGYICGKATNVKAGLQKCKKVGTAVKEALKD